MERRPFIRAAWLRDALRAYGGAARSEIPPLRPLVPRSEATQTLGSDRGR